MRAADVSIAATPSSSVERSGPDRRRPEPPLDRALPDRVEPTPGHRRFVAVCGAAVVAALLAVGGCATYQAPTTADSATATLQVDPNAVGLRIVTLDGLALTAAGAFLNPFSGRDPIKLSPGTRRVNLEFSTGDAYRRAQGYLALEFEAAAGKRYTVYERHDGTRFVAWITDGAGVTVSKPSAR